MTQATLEHEGEDPLAAWAYLARARTFLADARIDETSAEGRQLLGHQAVITACDALLAIEGWAVRGSDGGHKLRLAKAEDLLAADDDLFERLEAGRLTRNDVSYAALPAPTGQVDAAIQAASDLVDRVAATVEPRVPDYLKGV